MDEHVGICPVCGGWLFEDSQCNVIFCDTCDYYSDENEEC